MKSYHFPGNIQALVCSDFDETYFAHDLQNKNDIQAFESAMPEVIHKHNLLFGIVSASTQAMIETALQRGHFTYLPHFISTNSGTELFFIENGQWVKDETYNQYFLNQGINKDVILEMEAQLKQEGVHLITQEPFVDAPFSRNYYYKATDTTIDSEYFERIRQIAQSNKFIVNISKCNPLVGDPADHYDVDFFPKIAGKDAVVKYLIQKYDIPFENTFAFGDSGNDINMLNQVQHGYLVSNATDDAKSKHTKVLPHPYVKGILHALNEYLH